MKVKNAGALLRTAMDAAWQKDDPRLAWMLSNLAGISSVSFSDRVDTACIKKSGEKYMVLFSKKFVDKYLETPDDVLFVLLHEIMHKVHGDLERGMGLRTETDYRVANLVEDIVINARLCAQFFRTGLPLFDRIYSLKGFPSVLMVPPSNVPMEADRHKGDYDKRSVFIEFPEKDRGISGWQVSGFKRNLENIIKGLPDLPELSAYFKKRFGEEAPKALTNWYWKAWMENDRYTVYEFYSWIRPLFPDPPEVFLIGDHGDRSGTMEEWEEVFGKGAGHSDNEFEDEIDVQVPRRHLNRMIRMIREALEPDMMDPLEALCMERERSVLPWPGRRENLWLANGLFPVFYRPETWTKDYEHLRPHIYIDVSWSTSRKQPLVYGLVHHLSDLIGSPVYMFSNRVVEASMDDIRTGKVKTTGGTDFDCVMDHAARHHFRKVIMITDGCADMSRKNEAKLRSGKVELYLVLTDRTNFPHVAHLREMVRGMFELG